VRFSALTRAVVITALLYVTVQAQRPAAPAYHVGADVEAPVLLRKVDPEYTEEARAARLQGTVVVSTVIGEDGRAHDLKVVKGLGLGLDEKALESVAAWHFLAGKKGGQAVPVESTIEVNFRLAEDGGDLWLSRMAFTSPQGGQPALVSAQYRPIAGLPQNAEFRVSFDVDPQGRPINVRVDKSSNPEYDDDVIALIREWRFQAALNNGSAFQGHGSIDLTRGLGAQPPAPQIIGPVPNQIMVPAPKKKQ
jgi:TonB family protein